MWETGSMRIKKDIIEYQIKFYDEPSEFGIDGGCISKLLLTCQGKVVANYDRGWDVRPQGESAKLAFEFVMAAEALNNMINAAESRNN